MSLSTDRISVGRTFVSAAKDASLLRKLHEVTGILPEQLSFVLETLTLKDASDTAEAIRVIHDVGYRESQVAALMLAVGHAQERKLTRSDVTLLSESDPNPGVKGHFIEG